MRQAVVNGGLGEAEEVLISAHGTGTPLNDKNEAASIHVVFGELDGLTAGWFSEAAPSFGRAVWGFPEAVLGECSAPSPPSSAGVTKAVASLENSE